MPDNKTILENYIDRVWNQHDYTASTRMFDQITFSILPTYRQVERESKPFSR